MTNETFVQMWNILKENDFQIDVAIKSEIICTSCKNIMIKPCNVPCGCRYCYDCLRNHLNGEEKLCLEESDYCKSELINIDKNVFIDQSINIKISRIVVKCPLESCEFNTELGKMANHMRTCNRLPLTCPYYTIGCDEDKIDADKIKQHFKHENYCHARLLMDFVDNLRNEMKILKTNMLDLKKENHWTKEQMESKQNIIVALEENVAKLLQESISLKELETEKCHQNNLIEEIILAMQTKWNEQNDEIEKNKKKLDEMEINQEEMRTRIERITQEKMSLREELDIIKLDNKANEKIISALQTKSEEKEIEIEKVKQKCEFLEKNQDQMKARIEELFQVNKSLGDNLETVKQDITKQEIIVSLQTTGEQKEEIKVYENKIESLKQRFAEKCDQIEKNQEQIKTKIDQMSQENITMTTKSDQGESSMKTLETKLTQIQALHNCGEFMWCIQNWKEKKERARNGIDEIIYSDPFYTHKNGYKICLQLHPAGNIFGVGTHLSLYICIMRGEFDNILQWPFRHGVKLDLLNQETALTHVSEIVEYENRSNSEKWKKPQSERNIGIGFHQFIDLTELSSNASLWKDNQIWIKATSLIKR